MTTSWKRLSTTYSKGKCYSKVDMYNKSIYCLIKKKNFFLLHDFADKYLNTVSK